MYTALLMYYRERSVRTYKGKTYIREYWTAESSFYDKNGTKQRVRGRGATRAEATKRLNKNLRQRIDGTRTATGPRGGLTLNQWVNIWLATKQASEQMKPQTAQQHKIRYKQWIAPKLGSRPVKRLTAEEIQEVINAGAQQGHAIPVNIFKTMNAALNSAVKAGKVDLNPMKQLTPPRQRSAAGEKDTAHIEHWSRIMDKMCKWLAQPECELHDRYTLTIAMLLGLRRAELLGLTWDCFDERMNKLTIKQQLMRQNDGSYIIQNSTKTGKNRTLMLPERWKEAFLLQRQKSLTAAAPEWNNLVFLTPAGGPITYPMYNKLWRNTIVTYMAKEGQEWEEEQHYWRPHTCRKMCASWLAWGGVDIQTAMSILGHSSEAMTLYYTIINADQQRKALEGLSNVYEHHNVYNADYEAEGNGTLTKLRSDSIR